MLTLEPIPYEKANEKVKNIYEDIVSTFHIKTVPVFFELLANYEQYLIYVWPLIKRNVVNDQFVALCHELEKIFLANLGNVYNSKFAVMYLKNLQPTPTEIHTLEYENNQIVLVNIQLSLIFIMLREAIKGYAIGSTLLGGHPSSTNTAPQSQELSIVAVSENNESFDLQPSSNQLQRVFYPKFLALVSNEFEELIQTEGYLFNRVKIEEDMLSHFEKVPYIIDSSFSKTILKTESTDVRQLFHVLSETFPTLSVYKLTISLLSKIILKDVLNLT
jgi:hypothetical protein